MGVSIVHGPGRACTYVGLLGGVLESIQGAPGYTRFQGRIPGEYATRWKETSWFLLRAAYSPLFAKPRALIPDPTPTVTSTNVIDENDRTSFSCEYC